MVDANLQKIVYVNPAYERIWGGTCENLLRHQTAFIDTVHPEDRDRVSRMVEAQRRGIFQPEEYRLLRGDGSVRWIRDRAFPIKDDRGQIHRIAGIAEDVTDRKRAEAERLSLERKLMDAQKLESLGILAGGIAHDFNNLLTAILGNAALARMEFPPGATLQPYLVNIEKTSQQAAELCKQMLAFSGRGQFIMRKLDINGIVEEMTHLLQVSINKKTVLKLSLAANLPPVTVDPAQIRQVILNLIINASEAIGDKSGVIHASTGLMRADSAYLADTYFSPNLTAGDYVYLEVSDTGCGMSPQTRERIFDPFFSTKFTGRGLGLAAVLGIVRGHKGALKVYSELGRGSTFKFMLPCAQGAAEALYPLDPSAAWRGRGVILVVDDEETVRTVTARILETLGFSVLLAPDGAKGVDQFRRNHETITAVVLDMTMPHLDGEEAFREIRRIRGDARVLLVSGYSERDVTDRFAGKGLSGFLQKPFTPVELRDRLRAIVEPERI
jgi:PAS domain S-box-containing protein